MKRNLLTALVILFLSLVMAGSISAQTAARATWALTENQQATVTGNVVADSAAGPVLRVRDYTNAKMGGPLGANQARWFLGYASGTTANNWPASTGQENNLFVDFVVSPKPGVTFTIDSVVASLGGVGTNNMRANLYVGLDTALAQLLPLNTDPLVLHQASYYSSNPADTNVAYYVGLPVTSGQKFRFRIYGWYLSSSTSNSKYFCTQNIIIKGTTTGGTDVKDQNALPAEFSLGQNYPNPFNPSTSISYSIPKDAFVSLRVFNAIGQEVANPVNGMKNAGNYKLNFNASDLPSGIYFYRLEAGNFVSTKKMLLIK